MYIGPKYIYFKDFFFFKNSKSGNLAGTKAMIQVSTLELGRRENLLCSE